MTEEPDGETLMTRGRREALVHLGEEASEIAVAIAKCLRHGFDSTNPDDPGATNLEAIADEVGDLLGAVDILLFNLSKVDARTVWFRGRIASSRRQKLDNVERYMHHAAVPKAEWGGEWWGE